MSWLVGVRMFPFRQTLGDGSKRRRLRQKPPTRTLAPPALRQGQAEAYSRQPCSPSPEDPLPSPQGSPLPTALPFAPTPPFSPD